MGKYPPTYIADSVTLLRNFYVRDPLLYNNKLCLNAGVVFYLMKHPERDIVDSSRHIRVLFVLTLFFLVHDFFALEMVRVVFQVDAQIRAYSLGAFVFHLVELELV